MGVNYSALKQKEREIGKLQHDIKEHADELLARSKNIGYDLNNSQAICDRLVYYYGEQLRQFNRSTLSDTAVRVGIVPSEDDLKGINKNDICNAIVEHYRSRIDLIQYIEAITQSGLCVEAPLMFNANMSRMLQVAPSKISNEAYRRLGRLVDTVVTLMREGEDALYILRDTSAISEDQLKRFIQQVFDRLEQLQSECCYRRDALRQFAWDVKPGGGRGVQYENIYDGQVVEQLPQVSELVPERKERDIEQCQPVRGGNRDLVERQQAVGRARPEERRAQASAPRRNVVPAVAAAGARGGGRGAGAAQAFPQR